MDSGLARNSDGDMVQAEPIILITAEFQGLWDSPTDRDTEMQRAVEALMDSYKLHVTQLKAPW